MNNIISAEKRARKNKSNMYGVKRYDKRQDLTLELIQQKLENYSYKTSPYHIFTIFEPKQRLIYQLPYYPDRIVHHILMRILEPIFEKWFVKNTYSCIKNRGIHKMQSTIEHDLRTDVCGTKWCLKLDIRKFYPSINQDKLLQIISYKIKDRWLLSILKEIIHSSDKGVPIGNYLSQFFANIYLTKLDHYAKEILKRKHYYRYCDDIVILGSSKKELYKTYRLINQKLSFINLRLKQIKLFPTDYGIDFAGYVFRHKYTKIRKSLKLRFKRMLRKYSKDEFIQFRQRAASYYGWLIHCDGIHLLKTYINDLYYEFKKHYFKNFGIRTCRMEKR